VAIKKKKGGGANRKRGMVWGAFFKKEGTDRRRTNPFASTANAGTQLGNSPGEKGSKTPWTVVGEQGSEGKAIPEDAKPGAEKKNSLS